MVSSAGGRENPVISVKCWVPLLASGKIGAEEVGGKAEDAEGMTAVSSMVHVASPVNDGTSSSSSPLEGSTPCMRGTLPVNSMV